MLGMLVALNVLNEPLIGSLPMALFGFFCIVSVYVCDACEPVVEHWLLQLVWYR